MSLSLLVKFKHRSLYQITALFATEPREEPTDGGQCRKCSVLLCRWCHAEKCEREWSEKTPFETAVGASVKMKAKEEQEPTEW